MSRLLLKSTARAVSRLQARNISVSPVCSKELTLSPEQKEFLYPKIGDRDIVGFGLNGNPMYEDRLDYPFPAIRWKPNSAEVRALREKEKGDWKNLTLEEKKALYRASFCQTFSEMKAPTGEWKSILAITLMTAVWTALYIMWGELFVWEPLPDSMSDENKAKIVEKQVKQGKDPIMGTSSLYDFDKKQWK